MELPRVLEEVVRSYAAELSRDVNINGAAGDKVARDVDLLFAANPQLCWFLTTVTENMPEENRGAYATGFLQCYTLLQRQAEIDGLNEKR